MSVTRPAALGTVATGLAAAGVLAWVGPRIERFTTDSESYLDVAQNLLAGQGLVQNVVDFWRPAVPEPLGLWPPLYPTLVAAVSSIAGPPERAALLVSGASFVAFAMAFFALASRALPGGLAALATTIGVLLLPGVAVAGASAWSEPLFLFFVTAGLTGLVDLLSGSRAGRGLALLSGLCFGAAALTRYAGVPLAIGAVLVAATRGAAGRSRGAAVAFASGALVPPGLWLARNLVQFGSALGPSLPAAPRSPIEAAFILARALRWELLPGPLTMPAPLAWTVLVLLALGMAIAFRAGLAGRLTGLAAGILIAVVFFATASYAINDPAGRYLAPVLPLVWLAALAGLDGRHEKHGAGGRSAQTTAASLLFAVLAGIGVAGFVAGREKPPPGLALRDAELAELRVLVPAGDTPVLSDAGHRVRLASGRAAVQIPPAAWRPRAFDRADDMHWRARGVKEAVFRRPAVSLSEDWVPSDSTLHFILYRLL